MLAPTSMMVIYSKLGRDRRPRLSVKKHWQTTGGCLYMHDKLQSLLLWEKVAAVRLTDEEFWAFGNTSSTTPHSPSLSRACFSLFSSFSTFERIKSYPTHKNPSESKISGHLRALAPTPRNIITPCFRLHFVNLISTKLSTGISL